MVVKIICSTKSVSGPLSGTPVTWLAVAAWLKFQLPCQHINCPFWKQTSEVGKSAIVVDEEIWSIVWQQRCNLSGHSVLWQHFMTSFYLPGVLVYETRWDRGQVQTEQLISKKSFIYCCKPLSRQIVENHRFVLYQFGIDKWLLSEKTKCLAHYVFFFFFVLFFVWSADLILWMSSENTNHWWSCDVV